MILSKPVYPVLFALCLILTYVIGCEFDEPYVPDYAGSSTLAGRIITDPVMDLTATEVFLRGQDSFASVSGADGVFHFQHVPPGDYLLQVQKKPYLQDSFPVTIRKSTDERAGDLEFALTGAIAGTIPEDKLALIDAEVVLIMYIDGVPTTLQQDGEEDIVIDLSSESEINIRATIRITVYVDDTPYSATVFDGGQFLVEFVPTGIYSDIQVKANSEEATLPIALDGPVVVKSGQTRVLPPE